MDAVKSAFIWPIVSLIQYVRFTLSSIIILPVLGINYIVAGKKSLTNFKIYATSRKFPYIGKYFFSGLVSFFATYTANISGLVDELNDIHGSIIYLYDYPWLRNPYQSIHAIALANLGEYASGIVLVSQLQLRKDLRGVPVKITTEYYKKARGTLKAVSNAIDLSNITKKCDITLVTDIYDIQGVLVSKTFVTWTMEPKELKVISSNEKSSNDNKTKKKK